MRIAPPVYVLQQWVRSKEHYGLSHQEIAAEMRKRLEWYLDNVQLGDVLAEERRLASLALIGELEDGE